ncbi:hypothetical protein [Arcobacter sp.]|uniref:hypothetical protein n=1 Tax=Arcobacter sp. TaxID=1872629 RepID=UPI003D0AA38D
MENGQFDYCSSDYGQAELRLASTDTISGIDVTIRELSLSLVEDLFELLKCLNLFLLDGQGIDDVEHPTLFALCDDCFSHLPDDFTSTSCVIKKPDELYQYLSISFGAWSKYREQDITAELQSELDEELLKNDVIILKIYPNNDDLKTRLSEYRKIALTAGRTPLICLSARWCEPCQEMLVSLNHEDAKNLMKQVVIILIDIDDWGAYLYDNNIAPKCVPVFFNIDEDGSAGQLTVHGSAWDDDSIPDLITGVLRDTFKLK